MATLPKANKKVSYVKLTIFNGVEFSMLQIQKLSFKSSYENEVV
jgi:hypothetical protein